MGTLVSEFTEHETGFFEPNTNSGSNAVSTISNLAQRKKTHTIYKLNAPNARRKLVKVLDIKVGFYRV